MANFYKNLDSSQDVVSTRTLLHEAIPLTGTIVSGTYILHSTNTAENLRFMPQLTPNLKRREIYIIKWRKS